MNTIPNDIIETILISWTNWAGMKNKAGQLLRYELRLKIRVELKRGIILKHVCCVTRKSNAT